MTTMTTKPATCSGTFRIGGDLPVHRFGFGSMQLTGPGHWYHPDDLEEAKRVLRRAVDLGVTPAQLALAWLLHRSPVMLPIPGTRSVAHLEENLGAAELALTDDALDTISAALDTATAFADT
ncbi:hypothetical protein C3Y87_01770 [Carbonactinospora thermoautotrophica]|uniref:aldo/keto reductase n=1 Tax=Carbonactinospora thermoautotrophica TaxID=1469144 RepID=UPI0023EF1737|nr:aldo/keto reductase [Carbonactinospora thermoautotrophica]MCX9190160.1 hypothetical protein [Carbonactinospora thermoautotrophica]